MNLTPEQIASRLGERNPFATRSVRPGVLPYQLADGETWDQLVSSLRAQQWRGEVVGPHGTGKSTFLHSLIPFLCEAGRDVRPFTVQAGDSRLPISGADLKRWKANTQILIDGYEQLGGWTKTLIGRICRAEGCGLLVTAHESTGLPVLFRTASSVEMTQALVRKIQPGDAPRVNDHDVQLSFVKHNGNVREVFFELFDLYEQRRPLEKAAADQAVADQAVAVPG